jgi:hypothetical protein
MRLRQLKTILEEVTDLISINSTERSTNPRTYILQHSENLKVALNLLDDTNLFKDHITVLKSQSFYSNSSDSPIIPDPEWRLIKTNFGMLDDVVLAMIQAIEIAMPQASADVVSIKIPNPENFNDLVKIADSLNKVFGQTILNEDIGGNFKILNFDTGSFWIDVLFTGGAQVLHVVAAISWGGAVVYKKLQEGRLLSQQVRALKISSDAEEEISKKNKEALNTLSQHEAEFIYNSFYKGKDPEQISRIKLALNELAELYSQGAEIYPSLSAPQEFIEEFPDMKVIEKVKSKIKKLPPKVK